MTKGLLVVAAIMLGIPGSAAAQVTRNQLALALAQLQRAVDGLGAQRPARLVEAAQWLQRRGATADASRVSPEYVRALNTAATLLTVTPTPLIIEDVTEDLEAKVEHCRRLGIDMGGSVLLRVNTRRGAQTIGNWQVFYLLKIYERSSTSPAAFPTLSSPTATRLDPGRYWIWARDPTTGRTSERTLVRVSGKEEFGVDLPVP